VVVELLARPVHLVQVVHQLKVHLAQTERQELLEQVVLMVQLVVVEHPAQVLREHPVEMGKMAHPEHLELRVRLVQQVHLVRLEHPV
jgi:hypothetical protein